MDITELRLELRQIYCDLKQINADRERDCKAKRDRAELIEEIQKLKKAVHDFAGGRDE